MGNPEGSYIKLVSSIPIITGKTIIAPSARYLFVMKSIPPTISEVAISGINQVIVINVHPARRVQVYSGSGHGPVTYWRQRITDKEEELIPQEFIEAIGFAIEQA